MLDRELKRQRKPRANDNRLKKLLEIFDLSPPVEKLFEAIGRGHISLGQVFQQLFPEDKELEKTPRTPTFDRLVDKIRKSGTGIKLQGIGNLMLAYAGCCQPVPGDKVVGYITRGRGISIHRADCPNLLRVNTDPNRRVAIDWQAGSDQDFITRLLVTGTDRKGMLADLTTAITETETNIRSATTKTREFEFTAVFVVEVKDLKQLNRIIGSLKRIRGVDRVRRKESFSPEAIQSKN